MAHGHWSLALRSKIKTLAMCHRRITRPSGPPYVRLFDCPENHLCPACTAEARSSGLIKILATMISLSICQDGVGFPYLSPTCYWYMISGEEKALQYATINDMPADSAMIISQVH